MLGFLKTLKPSNLLDYTEGFKNSFYSDLLKKESLSDYIKVEGYIPDKKLFTLSDNHIGAVFECYPYTGVSSSVFKSLQSLYSSAYPKKTEIQFIIWGGDFLEPFVDRFYSLRKTPNFWVKKSADFILNHRKKGVNNVVRTPFRDFRFFVAVKIPYGEELSTDEAVEKYYDYFEDLEGRLASVHFFPVRLDAQAFIMYLYMMFNPDHDKRLFPFYSHSLPINRQIVMGDTYCRVIRDNVLLDNHYCSAFTIKKFPKDFYYGDILDFVGSYMRSEDQLTESSFLLSFNVVIGMHDRLKEVQNKKNKTLLKMRKIATESLPRLKERVDEAELVNQIISSGKKLVHANLVWWIYSKNKRALKHQEKMLETLVSEYKGEFEIQKESKQSALLQFFNATPFNSDYEIDRQVLQRYRTMFDYNAAHLTPYFADWKGTGTPVLYFMSRKGQVLSVSLHDSDEGYNFIVVAKTGSGKSFLMNHIISAYYSLEDVSNIYVIDIGRSYEALAKIYNGTFLDFSSDSNLVINPFEGLNKSMLDDMKDLLVTLLAKMAKPSGGADDDDLNLLRMALFRVVADKEGKDIYVDHIYDELYRIAGEERNFESKAKYLALGLREWTLKYGSYGKFINGKTNVDINNKLTVLEMKSLENKESLREVILMLFLSMITKKVVIEDNRERRKICAIDEFWRYMDSKDVVRFVRLAYKTWRKHKASIGTITQTVSDYLKSEDLKDIIFQSAFKFFLKQDAAAVESLKKSDAVLLSDYEYELMKSVNTVKGKYSEIFFLTPRGTGVGKLVVDEYLYWIYTSDANDVSLRTKLIEKYNGDVERAIEECIKVSKKETSEV